MNLNFRNVFAVLIWCSCIAIVALDGAGIITIKEMVMGSLLSIMTLVVQFFFRKRPADEKSSK